MAHVRRWIFYARIPVLHVQDALFPLATLRLTVDRTLKYTNCLRKKTGRNDCRKAQRDQETLGENTHSKRSVCDEAHHKIENTQETLDRAASTGIPHSAGFFGRSSYCTSQSLRKQTVYVKPGCCITWSCDWHRIKPECGKN